MAPTLARHTAPAVGPGDKSEQLARREACDRHDCSNTAASAGSSAARVGDGVQIHDSATAPRRRAAPASSAPVGSREHARSTRGTRQRAPSSPTPGRRSARCDDLADRARRRACTLPPCRDGPTSRVGQIVEPVTVVSEISMTALPADARRDAARHVRARAACAEALATPSEPGTRP